MVFSILSVELEKTSTMMESDTPFQLRYFLQFFAPQRQWIFSSSMGNL